MSESLGPLERVDGRWALGDAGRPGRAWVEFRTEGLYVRTRDASERLIPWPRVMSGGAITAMRGDRDGAHLHLTLRHPYEDQQVFFHRHRRHYRMADWGAVETLLCRVIADGEAHRLADADWLGRMIERLSGLGTWPTARRLRRAVTEALEAEALETEALEAGPPTTGEVNG